jgi:hypothetical protein
MTWRGREQRGGEAACERGEGRGEYGVGNVLGYIVLYACIITEHSMLCMYARHAVHIVLYVCMTRSAHRTVCMHDTQYTSYLRPVFAHIVQLLCRLLQLLLKIVSLGRDGFELVNEGV